MPLRPQVRMLLLSELQWKAMFIQLDPNSVLTIGKLSGTFRKEKKTKCKTQRRMKKYIRRCNGGAATSRGCYPENSAKCQNSEEHREKIEQESGMI